jgi:hypothetical protein
MTTMTMTVMSSPNTGKTSYALIGSDAICLAHVKTGKCLFNACNRQCR